MFAERLIRIVPEMVLDQAIFWGQPDLARFIAGRLGKDPFQAEKDTYQLMAVKNEGMWGGGMADFYRAKASIASFRSRIHQVRTNSVQS